MSAFTQTLVELHRRGVLMPWLQHTGVISRPDDGLVSLNCPGLYVLPIMGIPSRLAAAGGRG
jgi:hypothetical protein